jgi:hypothetical protein
MLTGWIYRSGGLGGKDGATGLYKTDCVYAVWRCFREIGMASWWDAQPKTVGTLVSYSHFPHDIPGSEVDGDILIHDGGPGHQHAGIRFPGGLEFSALNETAGVVVGRYPKSPPFTLVLHTGLLPRPIVPYVPQEGADMNPCKPTRLYDTRTKPGVKSLFGTGGGRLKAGVPRRFQITNPTGPIPPAAVLVAFSIQTVGSLGGWFHLSPETTIPDGISTLNETEPIVNGFPVIGLDAMGGVTAYSTIDTDLIIQVTAYTPAA